MAIYDEIGGPGAVGAAVDLFYGKIMADPSLSGYFEGVHMGRLRAHQRAFVTAALGGPSAYTGRAMGPAHEGLGITSAAFDTVVGHLASALTDLGVPAATIGQIAEALLPLKPEIVESAPVS